MRKFKVVSLTIYIGLLFQQLSILSNGRDCVCFLVKFPAHVVVKAVLSHENDESVLTSGTPIDFTTVWTFLDTLIVNAVSANELNPALLLLEVERFIHNGPK